MGRFYEQVKTRADGTHLTYYMQERSQAGEVGIKYGHGLVHGAKAVDKVCLTGAKPSDGRDPTIVASGDEATKHSHAAQASRTIELCMPEH